jgi:nicotinamidase-related amidase
MPVTALDPQTALVVIDLQKGIVGSNFIQPIAEVIERNRSLIAAFRQRDLPIVFVNVAGGAPGRTEQPRPQRTLVEGWTDLIPELDANHEDIR